MKIKFNTKKSPSGAKKPGRVPIQKANPTSDTTIPRYMGFLVNEYKPDVISTRLVVEFGRISVLFCAKSLLACMLNAIPEMNKIAPIILKANESLISKR